MAVHDGFLVSTFLAGRTRDFLFPDASTSISSVPIPILYRFGTITQGNRYYGTPESHLGSMIPATGKDVIFDQVYITSLVYDAGFIGETVTATIKVWNSSHVAEKSIDTTPVNPEGTTLLPDYTKITRNTNIFQTLTVFKEGPAAQNTIYKYLVGGIWLFELLVTGKRMLAFVYEPDWIGEVRMKYKFATVISTNEYFQEQRRPFYERPYREQKADFVFEKLMQERFLHEIKTFVQKFIAVPIFHECTNCTDANLQGLTVLNVRENLTYYYNLKNYCQNVLIMSKSDPHKNEIKTLVSSGTSSLVVSSAVVGSFVGTDTIIYPCFVGILASEPSFKVHTQRIVQTSLEFTEVI